MGLLVWRPDLMGRKSLAQNMPLGALIGRGYGARWSVRF